VAMSGMVAPFHKLATHGDQRVTLLELLSSCIGAPYLGLSP
jgi:hypothetical protein